VRFDNVESLRRLGLRLRRLMNDHERIVRRGCASVCTNFSPIQDGVLHRERFIPFQADLGAIGGDQGFADYELSRNSFLYRARATSAASKAIGCLDGRSGCGSTGERCALHRGLFVLRNRGSHFVARKAYAALRASSSGEASLAMRYRLQSCPLKADRKHAPTCRLYRVFYNPIKRRAGAGTNQSS